MRKKDTKVLFAPPSELVTKNDITGEFAELCKLLKVNPAVTKYRNYTSKKVKSSLASANPRFKGQSSSEPTVNKEVSKKDETVAKSGQIKEKIRRKSTEADAEHRKSNDEMSSSGSGGLREKNVAKKLFDDDKNSGNSSKVVASKESSTNKKAADDPIPSGEFKMPDNFDLPDELIMDGKPKYGGDAPSASYASSPANVSPPYVSPLVVDSISTQEETIHVPCQQPTVPTSKSTESFKASLGLNEHKKPRVSHSKHPMKKTKSFSARDELEEKRRRMLRKLKLEGPAEIPAKRKKSHHKHKYQAHRKPFKKSGGGESSKSRYKYEVDDDWLVDRYSSDNSWAPSGNTDLETPTDEGEISISTSSSETESKSSEKIKKRKRVHIKPPAVESDDEGDVGGSKTLERRDLNPRDLAKLIDGKARKRARVSVQLEEPDRILDRLHYLWRQRAMKEESESDDDDDSQKRRKKFNRINPFQSSSASEDDDEKPSKPPKPPKEGEKSPSRQPTRKECPPPSKEDSAKSVTNVTHRMFAQPALKSFQIPKKKPSDPPPQQSLTNKP